LTARPTWTKVGDLWAFRIRPGLGATVALNSGHVERPPYWSILVFRDGAREVDSIPALGETNSEFETAKSLAEEALGYDSRATVWDRLLEPEEDK
jgi:hypothetical protein